MVKLGNSGWSYDEVLPYFKKAEHNELVDDDFHGQNGPLVTAVENKSKYKDYFIEAGTKFYKEKGFQLLIKKELATILKKKAEDGMLQLI